MTDEERYSDILGVPAENIKEFFADVGSGLSLEESAVLHRIPYDKVSDLQKNDPSFSRNVKRARIHLKKETFKVLLSEAGRKSGAAAKLLARIFPEEEKPITEDKVSRILENLPSTPLVDPRAGLGVSPSLTPSPVNSQSMPVPSAREITKRLDGVENIMKASSVPGFKAPQRKVEKEPPVFSVDTF